MRKFLLAALTVIGLMGLAGGAHAACPITPNPNLNGPPFVDDCPLPASALNNLTNFGNTFSVKGFGAKGDGVTDDTQAVANAVAACGTAGGGTIFFVPSGHAYVIKTTATINTALLSAPGCSFGGVASFNWSDASLFYDNVEADWTKAGSWIRNDDLANGLVFSQPGQNIYGLNFWYTQPTPTTTTCTSAPCTFSGSSWAPTAYPYTMTFSTNANYNAIENVKVVNAYDCIDLEGPSNGVAGNFTHIHNVALGCFDRDLKFNRIDNTLDLSGGREQLQWFQGSTDVFNYTYNVGDHGIGWDVSYLANVQVNNWEITWKKLGIKLTDGTVTSGFGAVTFAGGGWQVNGLSFNENCQGMKVATNTTHFSSSLGSLGDNVFNNVLAYADTQYSKPGQCAGNTNGFFDFGSDNVAVQFHGLDVGFVDTLFNLGGVSGGAYLGVYGIRVFKYSAFNTGKPAFNIGNALNYFNLAGEMFNILPGTSAGPIVSGQTVATTTMLNEAQVQGYAGQVRQYCTGTNPASPTDTNTKRRWCFRTDTAAESGSNAGSNLDLDRYDDSGTYIDTPLSVNRTTGVIALNDPYAPKQSTVAGLPTCGGPQTGQIVVVTDQTAAVSFGAAVSAGGGSTRVIALCNGASWVQH